MGIFSCGRTTTKKGNYAPTSKGVKTLKLACWNIRTMLDKTDSNQPEHCSALIVHELSRLDVDIAALSEVCFPEEGSLQEHSTGYTLFWSGKPATERHLADLGLCSEPLSPSSWKTCQLAILTTSCPCTFF